MKELYALMHCEFNSFASRLGLLNKKSTAEYLTEHLTHFMSLVFFYTPWKHQKASGFLMFPGGIERYQWNEMG